MMPFIRLLLLSALLWLAQTLFIFVQNLKSFKSKFKYFMFVCRHITEKVWPYKPWVKMQMPWPPSLLVWPRTRKVLNYSLDLLKQSVTLSLKVRFELKNTGKIKGSTSSITAPAYRNTCVNRSFTR